MTDPARAAADYDYPSTDLRPCPFCGGRAVFGQVHDKNHPDFGGHFIVCMAPGCEASTCLRFACGEDPRPQLAHAWNRRHFPPPSELAANAAPNGGTADLYAALEGLAASIGASAVVGGIKQSQLTEVRLAAAKAALLAARGSRGCAAAVFAEAMTIDIVFDGPPGPEAGRFVEVESPPGTSIRFGEWVQRSDGYWVLRFQSISPSERPAAVPDGWRLVPVEPTREMVARVLGVPRLLNLDRARAEQLFADYRAMLAAAPAPHPAEREAAREGKE